MSSYFIGHFISLNFIGQSSYRAHPHSGRGDVGHTSSCEAHQSLWPSSNHHTGYISLFPLLFIISSFSSSCSTRTKMSELLPCGILLGVLAAHKGEENDHIFTRDLFLPQTITTEKESLLMITYIQQIFRYCRLHVPNAGWKTRIIKLQVLPSMNL